MTMATVWYVLIHATLGVIGQDAFRMTLPGVLACMAVSAVVQAWPTWEVHRVAWPKFKDRLRPDMPAAERARLMLGYWLRLGRLLMFRTSIFSIETLAVAAIARG
jgi:hypothetical protein